jgi:hypothetical protein
MFKNLTRREWIVLLIVFLLIPTLCGLFLFHYSMMTTVVPCTPATVWNFLWTCLVGTNVLMSVATGGILVAIPVIFFLINKIINTK